MPNSGHIGESVPMNRLVIIGIAILVITMPLAFVIPVITIIPGLLSSTLYTMASECASPLGQIGANFLGLQELCVAVSAVFYIVVGIGAVGAVMIVIGKRREAAGSG